MNQTRDAIVGGLLGIARQVDYIGSSGGWRHTTGVICGRIAAFNRFFEVVAGRARRHAYRRSIDLPRNIKEVRDGFHERTRRPIIRCRPSGSTHDTRGLIIVPAVGYHPEGFPDDPADCRSVEGNSRVLNCAVGVGDNLVAWTCPLIAVLAERNSAVESAGSGWARPKASRIAAEPGSGCRLHCFQNWRSSKG